MQGNLKPNAATIPSVTLFRLFYICIYCLVTAPQGIKPQWDWRFCCKQSVCVRLEPNDANVYAITDLF